VVAHTAMRLVSEHPVCGAKVGCAKIFLMPQPPLLTRRGLRSPIWLRLCRFLSLCGSYFFGGIGNRSDNIATCGRPRDIVLASSDCCAC